MSGFSYLQTTPRIPEVHEPRKAQSRSLIAVGPYGGNQSGREFASDNPTRLASNLWFHWQNSDLHKYCKSAAKFAHRLVLSSGHAAISRSAPPPTLDRASCHAKLAI